MYIRKVKSTNGLIDLARYIDRHIAERSEATSSSEERSEAMQSKGSLKP